MDDTPNRGNNLSRKELTGYNSLNMTQNSIGRINNNDNMSNTSNLDKNRQFVPLSKLN